MTRHPSSWSSPNCSVKSSGAVDAMSARRPRWIEDLIMSTINLSSPLFIRVIIPSVLVLTRALSAFPAYGQDLGSSSNLERVVVKAAELNQAGMSYARSGKYEEAEQAFEQAIRLQSTFSFAHYNLAIIYMMRKNFAEAISELTRVTELRPKYAEAFAILGNALVSAGDNGSALKALSKAIELEPKLSSAYNDLGVAYFNLKQQTNALDSFRKAEALNQKDAEIEFNVATTLMSLQNYEAAFAVYQQVSRLRPDWVTAQEYLGNAALRTQHFEEASEAYVRLTRLVPEDAAASEKLGLAYAKLKRYPQAIEAFERALQLNPRYARARFDLGLIYSYLNQKQAANAQMKLLQSIDAEIARELLDYIHADKVIKVRYPDPR
ncbi:MAG: hypothetical protein C5B55_13530 [Blastocatellia bacterium]|nr:MAG: hypothetical protein C5B55_13530 [Blastocatellia bacterium]